jgi:hypothetical protein
VLSKDGATFYLKPGWGIDHPRQLNRKWGVQGGFRRTFERLGRPERSHEAASSPVRDASLAELARTLRAVEA